MQCITIRLYKEVLSLKRFTSCRAAKLIFVGEIVARFTLEAFFYYLIVDLTVGKCSSAVDADILDAKIN